MSTVFPLECFVLTIRDMIDCTTLGDQKIWVPTFYSSPNKPSDLSVVTRLTYFVRSYHFRGHSLHSVVFPLCHIKRTMGMENISYPCFRCTYFLDLLVWHCYISPKRTRNCCQWGEIFRLLFGSVLLHQNHNHLHLSHNRVHLYHCTDNSPHPSFHGTPLSPTKRIHPV